MLADKDREAAKFLINSEKAGVPMELAGIVSEPLVTMEPEGWPPALVSARIVRSEFIMPLAAK